MTWQKLYNILIEEGIPKKLVNLVRMCLTKTLNKVIIGNNLSEKFEVRSGLKQGDSLSLVLFNLASEYAVREVMRTEKGLDLNGTTPLLGYVDDLVLLSEDVETRA